MANSTSDLTQIPIIGDYIQDAISTGNYAKNGTVATSLRALGKIDQDQYMLLLRASAFEFMGTEDKTTMFLENAGSLIPGEKIVGKVLGKAIELSEPAIGAVLDANSKTAKIGAMDNDEAAKLDIFTQLSESGVPKKHWPKMFREYEPPAPQQADIKINQMPASVLGAAVAANGAAASIQEGAQDIAQPSGHALPASAINADKVAALTK